MSVVGAAFVGHNTLSNANLNPTANDGHVTGTIASGTTGNSGALTTAKTDDIIFVSIVTNGVAVSGVSDTANLTWYQRVTVDNTSSLHMEKWFTQSPGTVSGDVITVTLATSGDAAFAVTAWSGTTYTFAFDPYAISSNIQTATLAPSDTLATADPTGIAIASFGWADGSGSTFTNGAGYTTIATINQSTNLGLAVEYQVLNTAQTALTSNGSLSVAENIVQVSDVLMALSGNVYTLRAPLNQEATIHNIYYNNVAGLPGHSNMIIGRVDEEGGDQAWATPTFNGALQNLHIHITQMTAGILFINTSTTDQYLVAWDGLRTL